MRKKKKKKKWPTVAFAILMALFFRNKSCLQISSCSTMHENMIKTGQISFSVTETRTYEVLQFLRDFDDYAII